MTITELRKQGFNVGDYIIVPNNEYTYEYVDEKKKRYYLYIGKIVKQDGRYYLEGYMVYTAATLFFKNPHSVCEWTHTYEDKSRFSTIQPIMQDVKHLDVCAGYSIKKVSKNMFDTMKAKLTNVADDVFEAFLKA